MNLLLRYVGHGITISLLVFIMLAFHLSALARTSEKRVLRVAFQQGVGMSWTAEDGSRHGMLVTISMRLPNIPVGNTSILIRTGKPC